MPTPRRAVFVAVFLLIVFYRMSKSPSHHNPGAVVGNSHTDAPDRRKASESRASADKTRPPTQKVIQKPMMDMSKMSLYDKLAYQFPYDPESRFPAFIWQTWKWTPADEAFEFRDQENSWTEQHPGFIHEIITDEAAENLLRLFYASVPEVLQAYRILPLPVFKADFFRYLILLARGGIYTDIDTFAIRPASEWVPERIPRESIGLVIGIEADPDRPDWREWYNRRVQFCQWTIQSKPGHPVLRDAVVRIVEDTMKRKKEGRLNYFTEQDVIDFTGPAVWTDAIMDYFNDPRYFDMKNSKGSIDWQNFTGMVAPKKVGDVVVLPITSFSPGVQQMGAKDYDDPMAFVKHDFNGSWKPEELRHIGETEDAGQPAVEEANQQGTEAKKEGGSGANKS